MTVAAKVEDTEKVVPFNRDTRAAKNSLKPEGHSRQRWWHKAGAHVTQDSVRHQEYWANIAPMLGRHDIISVIADDESWELELCVERSFQGGAEVSVRKNYKRLPISGAGRVVDDIGEFYSEWRPGQAWCIVRRTDGHPIVKGFTMESSAIAAWRAGLPKQVV